MRIISSLLGLLSAALLVKAQDIDPDADLNAFTNNTLFNRWRPRFHFLAPAGWMNDPCGAVYDPTHDLYHLMYQWHPNHVQWGNISWGHAVSKDLVAWTDMHGWRDDAAISLAPGPGEYDKLSVFTGTVLPVNITGGHDGTLLALYTSIRALPTNWRLPYIPGTESQSLATSVDGGKTWRKYGGNPVIEGHPEGWNITGLRDPFFQAWPEMDVLLGQEEEHFYMVMGSGIKDVGPRIPFYSAKKSDLTKWTFLGALWEPSMNQSFGDVEVTGSFGFNFEVSNFFSLKDSAGKAHYFVTMGAEGGSIPSHGRWSLWSEGQVIRRQNGSAEFDVLSSGVADWGNLYALTAFNDTKHDRRVQWGWSEEDMANYGVRAQGFQGALGLPREVFVKETHNIISEPGSPLSAKSGSYLTKHANGTLTARTLGVRPLPDVVAGLERKRKPRRFRRAATEGTSYLPLRSSHFHLRATLSTSSRAGLTVLSSPTSGEETRIIYDPSEHTISVDRTKSSLITQFVNTTAYGHYFAPLLADGKREAIALDVFVDGSLIEIFANDRFALTTRAYPSKMDAQRVALWGPAAAWSNIVAYDDLRNAFPERPVNSSSKLVWDGPEGSGNFTYWPGW